ncbi:AEC family transporter [Cognatishimia sp. SS12]|uniref:AEC family transporter n=1 Tax=Cognatishimia sp. SS12 TaxID=2979465 RepID=UPI00232D2E3B|nr:AEC family transporter [Cognatishimia sp. SS12]MDC0738681.1 AEC family transporter [Cognatishimia sp. SS12]
MAGNLNIILPVFVLIGLGYALRWRGIMTDQMIDALMRFALKLAVPALLFRAISTLDLAAHMNWPLLVSFYAGAGSCFLLGSLGARLLFGRSAQDSIAIGFCCLFSNSLLLGLPIADRAYGDAVLSSMFAIISVHSLFCYGLGITVMEISTAKGQSVLATLNTVRRGMFNNMLVLAIFAGFAVNLSGIQVPVPLADSFDLLARTALPVALFGIGGVLRRYRREGDSRIILFICALSLIIHPTIAFAMGHALSLPQDTLRAAVITATMPPGVNAYLFAALYGRAMRVAASSVLIGTAFSILTISVWLQILP